MRRSKAKAANQKPKHERERGTHAHTHTHTHTHTHRANRGDASDQCHTSSINRASRAEISSCSAANCFIWYCTSYLRARLISSESSTLLKQQQQQQQQQHMQWQAKHRFNADEHKAGK